MTDFCGPAGWSRVLPQIAGNVGTWA